MMKITIFGLAALALVCALPQEPPQAPPTEPQQPQPAESQPQPQAQAPPQQSQSQPQQAQPPQSQQQAPSQAGQAQPVEILKQESDVEINGYNFEFETSDGTARQEQGEYRNDTEQQGLSVKGSYRYIAPDGQHIAVSFIADKNGYQPTEHRDNDQQPASAPAQS